MIIKQGYPAEEHLVMTEDGYLLTLHRIPGSSPAGSPAVLIVHGGFSCSFDFVILGRNKSLGSFESLKVQCLTSQVTMFTFSCSFPTGRSGLRRMVGKFTRLAVLEVSREFSNESERILELQVMIAPKYLQLSALLTVTAR